MVLYPFKVSIPLGLLATTVVFLVTQSLRDAGLTNRDFCTSSGFSQISLWLSPSLEWSLSISQVVPGTPAASQPKRL